MTFPQPQGRRFLIRLKNKTPGRTRSSVSWRVLGMSHLLRLLDELVREMCCVGVEGASSDTDVVCCRGEGGGGGRGQLRSVSLASMCPVPPWLVVHASYDRAKLRYGGFWNWGIEKLPSVSLTSIIKVVEEGG